MTALWADFRFALRMMAKTPGFTAVLVITLALGIGASTTIFSVVNSVVLRPLPYPEPDRLMRMYIGFPTILGPNKFGTSPPEYFDLQRSCRSCESVAATDVGTASLAGGDRPVRVRAAWGTSTLLPTLGVKPLLGRTWTLEEDPPKADATVVVLGHGVWKRAFGGDPNVIGKKIMADAMPVTVIGVMPEGFDYPGGMEAWLPNGLDPASTARGNHRLHTIARLKPGVSVEAFRSELDALMAGWTGDKKPGTDGEHFLNKEYHPIYAFPLHDEVVGDSLAKTLWLLQGAVLFVLLIAIANITNLLLARAEARTREVAVRHALGATRGRLIRQLVTESVVLGLVGGALGLLVAVWALDATVAMIPASAPRVAEIALDGRSLAYALGLTLTSSLLFGLAPILHTRRTDVHSALKEGGPRTTGSKTRLRVRRVLVVTEIALAMVLVIGCGLMVRSFVRLQQADLGFNPDRVLTFEVELPAKTYPGATEVNGFWLRLQERLRGLPGVENATIVGDLPPQRPLLANDLGLIGKEPVPGKPWNCDYWFIVGDQALETMGARLVKGRALNESDRAASPTVVMVNEAFAAKFFPGEDPIGKMIDVSPWDDGKTPNQTIVGVVADIKQQGVDRASGTEVFIPYDQAQVVSETPERIMRAFVRTTGDPSALAPSAYQVLAELDPTLPISRVRTMDAVVWEAVARPRFLTFLLGAFAILALLLAAIGIYGVMAYTVAQRTHEIGIRMALGAKPGQVRAMVLRQAGLLVGLGVAIGLIAAFALELWLDATLAGVLYGGKLRDPLLFVIVTAVMTGAAMLATWLPARRATRVPPTVALRAE